MNISVYLWVYSLNCTNLLICDDNDNDDDDDDDYRTDRS